MSLDEPEPGLKAAVQRKGSFGQTLRAVAWSFFGVRRSADHEKDVTQLNPVHVVVAAIAGVALFIAVLMVVVQWVVGGGVAAS